MKYVRHVKLPFCLLQGAHETFPPHHVNMHWNDPNSSFIYKHKCTFALLGAFADCLCLCHKLSPCACLGRIQVTDYCWLKCTDLVQLCRGDTTSVPLQWPALIRCRMWAGSANSHTSRPGQPIGENTGAHKESFEHVALHNRIHTESRQRLRDWITHAAETSADLLWFKKTKILKIKKWDFFLQEVIFHRSQYVNGKVISRGRV